MITEPVKTLSYSFEAMKTRATRSTRLKSVKNWAAIRLRSWFIVVTSKHSAWLNETSKFYGENLKTECKQQWQCVCVCRCCVGDEWNRYEISKQSHMDLCVVGMTFLRKVIPRSWERVNIWCGMTFHMNVIPSFWVEAGVDYGMTFFWKVMP